MKHTYRRRLDLILDDLNKIKPPLTAEQKRKYIEASAKKYNPVNQSDIDKYLREKNLIP